MGRKSIVLMPQTLRVLSQMGEQIKDARVRRGIPADLVAERASVSRATIWAIEKGSPSVALGAYAAVLHAINGMDEELLFVARDEQMEAALFEIGHKPRSRAPRKRSSL